MGRQRGHSVEVMLRMYAAWLEGATDSDIHAIKQAMEKRPAARASYLDSGTAISAVNFAKNLVTQFVIRPAKSPEFDRSLAVGKSGTGRKEVAERVGFEPTCRNYPTIRFRVGAVVTTSVPLPEPQTGKLLF